MQYKRVTLSTGVSMDTYLPDPTTAAPKPRPGILVCPGGGYTHLAAHEGDSVALRFAGLGFNAYVVRYSLAPEARYPRNVQDVACAVAHIRENAQAYGQRPDAIAVLGFSAGGHVAGTLGVQWPKAELWSPLGLSCEQVKPNAMVLCYSVISGGEFAHRDSFRQLTGTDDILRHQDFSLEHLVTPQTAPAFLWHTWEDALVPVENTLLMAMALRHHGVPAEVHIYPHGPHGCSLCDDSIGRPDKIAPEAQEWPYQAARFLKDVMG